MPFKISARFFSGLSNGYQSLHQWDMIGAMLVFLILCHQKTGSSWYNQLHRAGLPLKFIVTQLVISPPVTKPKFITIFTEICHWILQWANWIQSTTSHSVTWRYILILVSSLHIDFKSDLFPWGFLTYILNVFSLTCVTCPANLMLLHLIKMAVLGE
jgi:hypothetical protein